jgi:hypothetical protein
MKTSPKILSLERIETRAQEAALYNRKESGCREPLSSVSSSICNRVPLLGVARIARAGFSSRI